MSTGTHGSSLKYKTLSDQVLALDVILANGTRRVFTNETDPFLMRVRGSCATACVIHQRCLCHAQVLDFRAHFG